MSMSTREPRSIHAASFILFQHALRDARLSFNIGLRLRTTVAATKTSRRYHAITRVMLSSPPLSSSVCPPITTSASENIIYFMNIRRCLTSCKTCDAALPLRHTFVMRTTSARIGVGAFVCQHGCSPATYHARRFTIYAIMPSSCSSAP